MCKYMAAEPPSIQTRSVRLELLLKVVSHSHGGFGQLDGDKCPCPCKVCQDHGFTLTLSCCSRNRSFGAESLERESKGEHVRKRPKGVRRPSKLRELMHTHIRDHGLSDALKDQDVTAFDLDFVHLAMSCK